MYTLFLYVLLVRLSRLFLSLLLTLRVKIDTIFHIHERRLCTQSDNGPIYIQSCPQDSCFTTPFLSNLNYLCVQIILCYISYMSISMSVYMYRSKICIFSCSSLYFVFYLESVVQNKISLPFSNLFMDYTCK